jgi:prepilin-type N-terminal cleavage/methylation domain-containing protein
MKTKKGFTLIELLVVIAIISLLSSVVLATLKEAKQKAKAAKFRQEMNQLIFALELYKDDNGNYPYDTVNYAYGKKLDGTESFSLAYNSLLDTTVLGKYISATPEVVSPIPGNNSYSWRYEINWGSPNAFNAHYRCEGDTVTPKQVLLVFENNNNYNFDAVSDWKFAESKSGGVGNWYVRDYIKCFHLN